jgi:heat shock transcription factor 1
MSQKGKEKLIQKALLPQEGIASFIRKTYEILEETKFTETVSWSDDGNFLVIKDAEEFSQKVLPVYFKHSNFTSFVRQLNIYNFHKKKTFNQHHVYFHELFKRGKTELLRHIKRKNEGIPKNLPMVAPLTEKSILNRYEALQSQVPNPMQLAQENFMLKQVNQKALARINYLETRMHEIICENKSLLLKITEKQENEDNLKNVIENYIQQVPPGESIEVSVQSSPDTHLRNNQYQDEGDSSKYQQSMNYLTIEPIQVQPSPTQETSMPSDSPKLEHTSSRNGHLTQNETNSEHNEYPQNTNTYNIPSYYEDEEEGIVLGKRTLKQLNDCESPQEPYLSENEPRRIACFENFKEGDKERINLLEIDFPLFVDEKQEERY